MFICHAWSLRSRWQEKAQRQEKRHEEGQQKDVMAARKFRKTRKDPKTGVAQKYLSGSKNRAAKAAEIKETARKYKRGENIDVKAVSRSRSQQDASKTTKRKNKKGPKRKG